MVEVIENIGIALLVAGVLTFVAYYIATLFKGGYFTVTHFVGLCTLFILLTYQSYRLLDAWSEKSAIEDAMLAINTWSDEAIDIVDNVDKRHGGDGKAGERIRDVMSDPLVQRSLSLFGIDVGTSETMTIEMGEELKSAYNWYMFRRLCWIVGFMVAFVIFVICLPSKGDYHPRKVSRVSHRATRHQSRTSSRR